MNELKAAVIGLGGVSTVHINSLDIIGIPITAMCDIKPELVNKRACSYFTDYNAMLSSGGFDVLHICLPHYLHAPVSIAALKKGIHVICEKPMATTVEDANAMVSAANESKASLEIIFQNRYNHSTQTVKAVLDSGELGRITGGWLQVTWHRTQAYYESADWRGKLKTSGGGVLINQAIHSFDLMNYLVSNTFGNPTSVIGTTANRTFPTIEIEDIAEGIIQYGDAKFSFYTNLFHPYDAPVTLQIICENGRVSLTGDIATIEYNNGRVETFSDDVSSKKNFGKDYWGYSHIKQIQSIYEHLTGKTSERVSGLEGLRTQRIINGIYESAKLGRPVEV